MLGKKNFKVTFRINVAVHDLTPQKDIWKEVHLRKIPKNVYQFCVNLPNLS